ncbi:hypothetical protein GCM10009601_05000 [Streptomyces thermospinosisporus]|uniref:Uncharacterized protein n=1 Tax=Streptomyces thermospinosisporus TaxID=161482 RepID=A0ABP4J7I5_9ACTN
MAAAEVYQVVVTAGGRSPGLGATGSAGVAEGRGRCGGVVTAAVGREGRAEGVRPGDRSGFAVGVPGFGGFAVGVPGSGGFAVGVPGSAVGFSGFTGFAVGLRVRPGDASVSVGVRPGAGGLPGGLVRRPGAVVAGRLGGA